VGTLHVMGRCKCGDDFCAEVYVQPPPQGKVPGEVENVDLSPKEGHLILGVVDGRISTIEILYRPEIRRVLLEMFP
jgi:hypothetical protein